MPQWIKFFVFSISHGHTGASVVKGDKDDYGIGECAMGGAVERAGIVRQKRKLRQDMSLYIPYQYLYVSIYKNT